MTMFEKLCSERTIMNAWKHVKSKGSAGGIDGLSLTTFETDLGNNILEIIDELKTGKWSPLPYLKVEIPKKVTEKRKLGLLTVKDKVVQQAIKSLVEPFLRVQSCHRFSQTYISILSISSYYPVICHT